MAAGPKSHWQTVCVLPVINGGRNLSRTALTGCIFSNTLTEKKKPHRSGRGRRHVRTLRRRRIALATAGGVVFSRSNGKINKSVLEGSLFSGCPEKKKKQRARLAAVTPEGSHLRSGAAKNHNEKKFRSEEVVAQMHCTQIRIQYATATVPSTPLPLPKHTHTNSLIYASTHSTSSHP